jgi:phosphate transport system substrate-binding protein
VDHEGAKLTKKTKREARLAAGKRLAANRLTSRRPSCWGPSCASRFASFARSTSSWSILLAFLLVSFAAACSAGPTPTPAPTQLRISGSTSMGLALHEVGAAFQAQNPNVLVEVQGGDTANGLEDLRAGRSDVAALSWWDEAQSLPQGYRLVPVAKDAVAVIVHPRNPITDVTALQLKALFGGEMLDWTALGGEQGEPVIVSREDGSGTRSTFEARIMADRRVTLNALVMPTTKAVADYVAGHRLAVGYVSLDAVDDRVRAVPVEGLLPSRQSAADNSYHLTRVLYLAVREPVSPGLQAFLDFAQSPAGAAIWSNRFAGIR